MTWWKPSKPGELPSTPWLAPDVISYLENLLRPGWEVIEHGSGGSTLWFAERVKSVEPFETNPKWQATVEKGLDGRDNVSFSPDPLPILHKQYDLLLIDGEPIEDRAKWITAAPQIIRPGGWVVLDNANRPEYARERKHLQAFAAQVETFDRNEGGTLYLVTEFYRMPEGAVWINVEGQAEKPKKRRKKE